MKKKINYYIETILWLNQQIDNINSKATTIGELLMRENDPAIIENYDTKLMELEQQLRIVNKKLELEKNGFGC